MAQEYPVRSKGGWYLARMGWLEWQETILKLGAIATGITAFALAFSTDKLALPSSLGLVQFAILAIMSLGLFGAIFERLNQREIGAMGFVLLNNLGHWGLLLALTSGLSGSGILLPVKMNTVIGAAGGLKACQRRDNRLFWMNGAGSHAKRHQYNQNQQDLHISEHSFQLKTDIRQLYHLQAHVFQWNTEEDTPFQMVRSIARQRSA